MVFKTLYEKSVAPHLLAFGYTFYGNARGGLPGLLAELFVKSSVLAPVRQVYVDSWKHRNTPYGASIANITNFRV